MGLKLRIKIWGSRGSLPAPVDPGALEARIRAVLHEFLAQKLSQANEINEFLTSLPQYARGGYGGDTICVEVRSAKRKIIIDAGSGLRNLGYELMEGECGRGKGEVHLFFTHFHWDHLIGLPFFTPLFIPGNVIHAYSVQPGLKQVFQTMFKKPFFPIQFAQVPAKIVFHQIKPRKAHVFGDMKITPYELDHPDPCWGYRIESGGRVYSHCVDTECKRVSREELGLDLPLYQDVDLMTFDAQYTLIEKLEKVDWGHATASLGLEIAMRESIRRIVFIHHDPASSAEKVVAAEDQARRFYEAQLKKNPRVHRVNWSFGFDGFEADA